MAVETRNTDAFAASIGKNWAPAVGAALEPVVTMFEHTQDIAGDATSVVNLIKLPPGRVRILKGLSRFNYSAFGAGRTLDVGHLAYVDREGNAVVADPDSLLDGKAVAAAGNTELTFSGQPWIEYSSRAGVTIQATVLGGTIPAAATIKGMIAYVRLPA